MDEPNDERPIGEQIESALGEAVRETLSRFGSDYVIKWVAAVEVLDAEGDRGIWTFVSDGATRWDVYGMLQELEIFQIAHQISHILRDE